MLIDTHAHVNFKGFAEDAESVIQRALDAGVSVVNVGTQIDTSRQAVEMAEKFKLTPPDPLFRKEGESEVRVYAVIGLHPVHTYSQNLQEEETHFKTREEKFDYKTYLELGKNPLVVGVGECGLDYFRLPAEMSHEAGIMSQEEIKQKQKDAFIKQIKLAKELDKALVIHTRSSPGTDDACLDTLEILKSEYSIQNTVYRLVLHSYTGSPEVAKKFIELGAYISFNGILTFDKTGNQEAVLREVPDNRILLETDCPYLTPVPMRGKRNEPVFVKHVAEHVAKLKNMSLEEVEELTTQNAKEFYKI
jgi:TatD DNase family protein